MALGKPQYVPPVMVAMIVGLGTTAYLSAPLGLNGVAACVLAWYVFFLFVNHYFLLHRVGGSDSVTSSRMQSHRFSPVCRSPWWAGRPCTAWKLPAQRL